MKGSPEIRLSSAAGLPQQIAEHLTGEIRGGVLKLGQKLPPEADLCKQYGVSRTVIRELLPGCGMTVCWNPARAAASLSDPGKIGGPSGWIGSI